ncbi:hypothetical protein HETIRDRAFT_407343 [Heterobasidion irregulare TC 32-1]|uniref:Uncharacterized protein n=1 Tax=Heterobasidion irregulare (strain TC 32-1) TaxID=747525 RepID=W4KIC5_HETIT|nr:uncharacterized protein HETIRDRAFT_407343 [Heterobasidion irregulare TC 32-1]ETW85065.1 hypothetical protein HETIRDRAFT_407343 [Heterobasidion irregulare TC 32-1]
MGLTLPDDRPGVHAFCTAFIQAAIMSLSDYRFIHANTNQDYPSTQGYLKTRRPASSLPRWTAVRRAPQFPSLPGLGLCVGCSSCSLKICTALLNLTEHIPSSPPHNRARYFPSPPPTREYWEARCTAPQRRIRSSRMTGRRG